MASNYPTSLDNFTNPTSNDSLNSPSHSLQHANINDAVEAIEAKLGIGASTAGSATSGQVLTAGTGGTTTWQTLTIPEPGLTLISAQTMTTNTLNFTNVFNSTYSHYLLVGNCYNSTSQTMLIRSRQNTSDYTGSGYYGAIFEANYNATTNIEGRNNQTHAFLVEQASSSAEQSQVFVKMFPNGNSLVVNGTTYDQFTNGVGLSGMTVTGSATCTGFTIYTNSGTQNGYFALYGFKKS